MHLSAATIAKDNVHWLIPDIPHITYCDGYQPVFLTGEAKSLDRVEYLAKRRNDAVRELLRLYPSTTDILMIDSHYCSQQHEIRQLTCDYLDAQGEKILGGSTWFHSQMWPHRRIIFWDSWTTPEGLAINYNQGIDRWKASGHALDGYGGFLKVKAVGGAMIFPVSAWKNHPFDATCFPRGSEINGFCENSDLPVYVDFYSRFWHPEPEQYGLLRTVKAKTYKPARIKIGEWLHGS